MRDDILFQELRELRTAQTALNRSLDSLMQLLAQFIALFRGSAQDGCRCRAEPTPPSPPPPDEAELYPLEQVARMLRRSEQVTRCWCREIETAETAAIKRATEQQKVEMDRQKVPQELRHFLFKLPARTVRHVGGNDKGLWEVTPAGLRKLQAMNNVRPRRPSENGDAEDGKETP